MEKPKKVLGIDVGVASIGWAYIEEDIEPSKCRILDMGVRIVPLGNETDDFKKGKAVSLNAKRTEARGARRNLQREKQRRQKVIRLLKENEMYPNDELIHLRKYSNEAYDIAEKDPVNYKLYALHARAVEQKITLQELGMIILHMTQQRGYQSNRKTKAGENEGTDYLRDIKLNSDALGDDTIGQFFFKQFKADRDEMKSRKGKPYEMTRVKFDSSNAPKSKEKKKEGEKTNEENRIFFRDNYKNEFNKIWEKQSTLYKKVLTPELKKQIGERGLFFQRPLKSQKGKISRCRYFKNYKVAPKSSPFFQIFRIWQNVNALLLEDDQLRGHTLTVLEKAEIFEHLNKSKEMTGAAVIKKVLKLDYDRKYTLNKQTKEKQPINFKKIEGNRYNYELLKILKDKIFDNFTKEEKEKFVEFDPFIENPENQLSYRLWHVLYSVDDEKQLYETLQKDVEGKVKFGFNLEQAIALGGIYLEDGYCSLSTKALKELLRHMIPGHETEEGDLYPTACEKLGFRHSDWEDKQERETKDMEDVAKPVEKGELRNPIVEKILNQAINLVNEIIASEALGRPDEIRVELTRELKQNRKKRDEVTKKIKSETERNQRIVDDIKEYSKSHNTYIKITRKAIERWKLWEDAGETCIYSGEKIPIGEVLNEHSKYDIDHIIPQAKRYDDSLSNKVLTKRSENAKKGDRTAKDYILEKQGKGEMSYMEYIAIIKNSIKNGSKIQKLQTGEDDLTDGFITRQIKETQYISREFTKRLRPVCREVTSTTGSITSHLRNEWGINQVMRELFPKNHEGTWSKRDDHRHHPADALVVACTTQRIITYLNTLHSREKGEKLGQKVWQIPIPWHGFVAETKARMSEILVSFKSKNRVAVVNTNKYKAKIGQGKRKVIGTQTVLTPRGFLHKETVYGRKKKCLKQKVKVSKILKEKMLEYIVHPAESQAVGAYLAQYNNDIAAAIKDLKKNPIIIQGRKKPLTEVVVWKWVYTVRKPIVGLTQKQAGEIMAKDIRRETLARFEEEGNLKNVNSNRPINSNYGKGTQVKRVKIATDLKDLQALHENENGEPIDFVNLRNNHHAAVYKDEKGDYYNEVLSFWTAFERHRTQWEARKNLPKGAKKMPIELVKKDNLDEGHQFIVSLSINEMFVKDLNPDAIDFKDKKNYPLISKHLYRVQNVSDKDYVLSHHLLTESKNKQQQIRITNLSKLESYTKVSINRLGMITDVQKIAPAKK